VARCEVVAMDVVEDFFRCTNCTGQGNQFELNPTAKMETRHPVEGSFGNEFPLICNHFGVTAAWSRKTKMFAIFCVFFAKTTPYRKIFKIQFRKNSSPHQSTSHVQISWNLADGKAVKSCVIYLTKKFALATVRLAPKVYQGQPQTIYSECSRFHLNRFTFVGVTPERVNNMKTRLIILCTCVCVCVCVCQSEVNESFLRSVRNGNLSVAREHLDYAGVHVATSNAVSLRNCFYTSFVHNKKLLEMWANARRDGYPAEYKFLRWRPLFNAAKFRWRHFVKSVVQ